jgi:hypothetical protein
MGNGNIDLWYWGVVLYINDSRERGPFDLQKQLANATSDYPSIALAVVVSCVYVHEVIQYNRYHRRQ